MCSCRKSRVGCSGSSPSLSARRTHLCPLISLDKRFACSRVRLNEATCPGVEGTCAGTRWRGGDPSGGPSRPGAVTSIEASNESEGRCFLSRRGKCTTHKANSHQTRPPHANPLYQPCATYESRRAALEAYQEVGGVARNRAPDWATHTRHDSSSTRNDTRHKGRGNDRTARKATVARVCKQQDNHGESNALEGQRSRRVGIRSNKGAKAT